ncbi:hypothetical protein NKE50_00060 [Streptococcus suis]|nr:hypothetical protein [Streptococcus suis]MCO8187896.1 hypothetical protein [Streptococcus suis]MCO8203767.1 hypothetical protein [Streptococcus suis]MCO8230224.1 hypothetical protein [Streptococcus suis]
MKKPELNSYHVVVGVTTQNEEAEFRLCITVFINNGLPISYIEIKQPDAIYDGKIGYDNQHLRQRQGRVLLLFRRLSSMLSKRSVQMSW